MYPRYTVLHFVYEISVINISVPLTMDILIPGSHRSGKFSLSTKFSVYGQRDSQNADIFLAPMDTDSARIVPAEVADTVVLRVKMAA